LIIGSPSDLTGACPRCPPWAAGRSATPRSPWPTPRPGGGRGGGVVSPLLQAEVGRPLFSPLPNNYVHGLGNKTVDGPTGRGPPPPPRLPGCSTRCSWSTAVCAPIPARLKHRYTGPDPCTPCSLQPDTQYFFSRLGFVCCSPLVAIPLGRVSHHWAMVAAKSATWEARRRKSYTPPPPTGNGGGGEHALFSLVRDPPPSEPPQGRCRRCGSRSRTTPSATPSPPSSSPPTPPTSGGPRPRRNPSNVRGVGNMGGVCVCEIWIRWTDLLVRLLLLPGWEVCLLPDWWDGWWGVIYFHGHPGGGQPIWADTSCFPRII